jgi:hypothetical protein
MSVWARLLALLIPLGLHDTGRPRVDVRAWVASLSAREAESTTIHYRCGNKVGTFTFFRHTYVVEIGTPDPEQHRASSPNKRTRPR